MPTFAGTFDYIASKLRGIPIPQDGGASSSKSNIVAHTAFSGANVLTLPALEDRVGFEAWFKFTVDPGDSCRIKCLVAGQAESLTGAGVELFSFDIADSGQVYIKGHVVINGLGTIVGGGLMDHEAVIKTGGAIGPSLLTSVELDTPINTSGSWQIGFSITNLGTWGAGSTATLRNLKTRRLADQSL